MTTRRWGSRFILGACVMLLAPAIGVAQEKDDARQREQLRDGLIVRAVHLMPPAFAAQLDLTPQQREQIQKLDQEFKGKRRTALTETAAKVMEIVECMQKGEDPELAPVLAICHEITGGLLESRRTRLAYEQKVCALLNADQQEQLARLKERGPRERRQERVAERGEEAASQRLERLQLTEEQKKKLADLKQEMETRFRAVLTEQQKRQLDGRSQDRAEPQQARPGSAPANADK